jgi:hypothetical protein
MTDKHSKTGKKFQSNVVQPHPDNNTRCTFLIKISELKLTAGYCYIAGSCKVNQTTVYTYNVHDHYKVSPSARRASAANVVCRTTDEDSTLISLVLSFAH